MFSRQNAIHHDSINTVITMKQLLYIDLFCGAGGTSTGVNSARLDGEQCAEVIACVNHDANAIASHASNHPTALHYTEDIRTLELTPLVNHTAECKAANPGAMVVLWASLECTNFSKAKGGMPRDADSRTLAEHLFRYIEALNPDYIQIENVEEFMSWGDLDENGKPISKDKGRSYLRWVDNVKHYGYDYDFRILNAADFGAYTMRKRFFGIFAKHGLPITFPEQTHSKNGESHIFGQYEKWNAVRDVLDLDDVGTSIFDRKRPLVDKTLKRIYAGLIKFVAGGKKAFEERCQSVSCAPESNGERVSFLSKQFSGNPHDKNISIDGPCGTITTIDHHAFVTAYYKNGSNNSIAEPSPTLTTHDRLAVVNPQFIDTQYGNGTPTSIDSPSGTLLANPKQKLVTLVPWVMDTNFENVGSSIDEPARVITANRKQHYLMNPQFASAGSSVDAPCFTLIARMDKRPPYFVTTESGNMAIRISENDTPMMIKIKEFMLLYGLADIKMRMFKIPEMKRIMGFPEDYVLIGTKAEQKKYIGNAVEVTIARAWCVALCRIIINHQMKKTA